MKVIASRSLSRLSLRKRKTVKHVKHMHAGTQTYWITHTHTLTCTHRGREEKAGGNWSLRHQPITRGKRGKTNLMCNFITPICLPTQGVHSRHNLFLNQEQISRSCWLLVKNWWTHSLSFPLNPSINFEVLPAFSASHTHQQQNCTTCETWRREACVI